MIDHHAILDAVLGNIRDAVILADRDRNPLLVNKAFEVLTGHKGNVLTGDATEHVEAARAMIARALGTTDGGRWLGAIRCADGQDRLFDITVSAVNGPEAFPSHFIAVVRPAQEGAAEAGGKRFGHDELTGLPNRDIFVDRVDQAVLQSNRTNGTIALLLMGLDRFTLVNDALGHAAGDRLLVEVARRLRQCIRETDTLVRLDGDRFAMVMSIADVDDSVIVAEKVLKAIKVPFGIDGQEVVVTFSIGIALYPQDASNGSALIKNGENALHHAKVSGRNQYQFFSKDMNRKAKARLELEARMRRALANEEFVVFFQPKVSNEDSRIVGAEALVRWMDPERGMVSPGEFIPVAEETGLIEQIGNWVLKKSCLHTVGWQAAGIKPVRVSVNVSPRQFRSRSFLDTVTGILAETGLESRWLELEITESMLMHDVELAVGKMTALRELGLGLSIDDFGTGYSSLSYLGRFPITTLKIDRAFIADVDTNPKTAEIARAIIGLSRGLNLEVVAEGCEVAEHVDFLRQNGCSTVQGFYYSRPVAADVFEAMLREGKVSRSG